MEKISWTDHVRNEEVLPRVKEQRNIIHEISKWKANWIGHILRKNCLLQQVIEGKIEGRIEVTGRRGRRRRKLLDDLKERRGYSHLKEEAPDRTMWRARFGRVFARSCRKADYWMNEWVTLLQRVQFCTRILVCGGFSRGGGRAYWVSWSGEGWELFAWNVSVKRSTVITAAERTRPGTKLLLH
jgi:hypothetical protein